MKQDMDSGETLEQIRHAALDDLYEYFRDKHKPINAFSGLDEGIKAFKAGADAYGLSVADFIAIMHYVAQPSGAL